MTPLTRRKHRDALRCGRSRRSCRFLNGLTFACHACVPVIRSVIIAVFSWDLIGVVDDCKCWPGFLSLSPALYVSSTHALFEQLDTAPSCTRKEKQTPIALLRKRNCYVNVMENVMHWGSHFKSSEHLTWKTILNRIMCTLFCVAFTGKQARPYLHATMTPRWLKLWLKSLSKIWHARRKNTTELEWRQSPPLIGSIFYVT